MPRNMSFSMTTEQFRDRTKTVTRRFGWWNLKAGDVVRGVEKAMGLKKGEKVKPLGMIRILSVRDEPLSAITTGDCRLEGFPDMPPVEFVEQLCSATGKRPTDLVNRIEFEYVD